MTSINTNFENKIAAMSDIERVEYLKQLELKNQESSCKCCKNFKGGVCEECGELVDL